MIRSMIIKLINLYRNYAVRLFKIHILKDGFLIAHRQWVNDNKDKGESLRYKYSLNENSIVFDIGGYEGEFAQKIFDRFGCTIYVFEPVKEYYDSIVKRFKNNPKIRIFDFGLSDNDEIRSITLSDNGTSIFIDEGEKENIALKSAADFLNKNNIEHIDLLKINTEGGEFSVLPDLIENHKVHNIKNLQIQFHNFVPDAERLREKIRNDLSQTHHLTYDYYFVWENWELNQ